MIGRALAIGCAVLAGCQSTSTPAPERSDITPVGCVRVLGDADHDTVPAGWTFSGDGSWRTAAGVLIGWAEQEDGAIYNVKGCGPVYE